MLIAGNNVNSAGQLTGVGLHDSVLVGMSVDFDNELTASFRRTDGSLVRLTLSGLGPMGIVGLRNGAIVSDVFAWKPAGVPTNSIERPDGVWSVLFAGDIRPADLVRVSQDQITDGRFGWIVLVECSFGGSLAALCQQIDVVDG